MFVLRLVLGWIFVAHGAQKLFGMFGGIGIDGTTKMMEGLGFVYPYLCAVVWSSVEFLGGAFLLFGVLSRYAASLIALCMAITIWKINMAYGFFIQDGGFEYSLLIIAACCPVVLLGGGNWSLWDV
jgi:putative oxidoreductase